MYIKHVAIKGFWGNFQAATDLPRDVAIFIGANGTGKTTLINLLVAALTANYDALVSWQFEQILIRLGDSENERVTETVQVKRLADVSPPAFQYTLGKKNYLLERDPRRKFNQSYLAYSVDPIRRRDIGELREKLAAAVNLSWIAVHRYVPTADEEDPSVARQSAVDQRLRVMLDRLAKLQLRIENKSQELSRKFQSSVLALLLYNPVLDTLGNILSDASATNLQAEEEDIKHAVEALGIEVPKERIGLHFSRLKKALETARSLPGGSAAKNFDFEDLILLPMLLRTKLIIDDLKNTEVHRDELKRPLNTFLAVVHGFITRKRFWFDERTSELKIALVTKTSEQAIRVPDLSSGEKQLLIQLLEVLLQENKPSVLISDEPELSLHVSWQENLLRALRKLNENAQIIVATHSPDIVGPYRSSVIDMENIVLESSK